MNWFNRLREYLQRTPYTARCWGDSYWQERQPLYEIPASLCLTSVKIGNADCHKKGKNHTDSEMWSWCNIIHGSLLQICQSLWWHIGVHPVWIWQGRPFQMNLPRFSSPFRTCPCQWDDWLLMLDLQTHIEKHIAKPWCPSLDHKASLMTAAQFCKRQ